MRGDERYTDINQKTYPPITRADAGRFALKIVRHFGSPNDAAYRSGFDGVAIRPTRAELMRIYRRYADRRDRWGRTCWASTKATRDHHKGWGRLIHDVSHIIHEFRHPKERPHGPLHSGIEREVLRYVEAQGWLEPTKPIKSSLTLDQRRINKSINLQARLKRWETKHKRAITAIRKIKRSLARLDKLATRRTTDASLDAPHALV